MRLRSPSPVAWGVSVELHCAQAPPIATCVRAIETATTTTQPADVAALEASDAGCAAFAQHDRAHRLSLAGKAAAAHAAYALAAAAWRRTGDARREAAALLGQADQSSNAGLLQRALFESMRAEIANRRAGNAAFALRARNTQALTFRRLGKEPAAVAVYRSTLPRLAELAEWNEWALARYNLAVPALQTGDDAGVQEHLAAIDSIDPALLTPVNRGRFAILRMLHASYGGDLLQALRQARAAEGEFESAGATGQLVYLARVQANLYRLLGLYPEAWDALARAATLAPPTESPQRTAGILLSYARIEQDRGRLGLARLWIAAAEHLYQTLGFDKESRWTAAFRLGIDWRAGRAAEDMLAEAGALAGDRLIASACAPHAAALALDNRPSQALTLLDDPRCRPNGLDDAIDQARARAVAMARLGDRPGAASHLLQFARAVDLSLGEAGAALRYAARRRLLQLRDAWIVAADGRDPQATLDIAIATHPALTGPQHAQAGASGASGAIGRVLLGDSESGEATAATRALIDSLANAGARPRGAGVRLADLQSGLGPDEWLLVWLHGELEGRALWIGAHAASVVPVAGREPLQRALAALHHEFANPRVEVAALDARASEFSALLFAGSPARSPPARLWLLADETIGSAPLALLRWPGQDDPLVESSTTGWVTAIETAASAPIGQSPELHALVATHGGLGALPTAAVEPELIVGAVPDLPLSTHRGEAASPERLVAVLSTPGSVVHLAAHGMARTERLGHSGVWLSPPAGASEPRFLSWLDIADLRLASRLAVLNACDLAAGPSAMRQGSLSFAAALANAGVAEVIAASWQTSDAASRVWVPAFYRALDAQRTHTSADALRAAQQALRRTPHFRHPWYWASLAHYRALRVPPAASPANAAP